MNRRTESLKGQYGKLFGIVKDALGELESWIGIEVPESECAYLVELLTEHD
jgi:transcriptional antiterminator